MTVEDKNLPYEIKKNRREKGRTEQKTNACGTKKGCVRNRRSRFQAQPLCICFSKPRNVQSFLLAYLCMQSGIILLYVSSPSSVEVSSMSAVVRSEA